MIQLDEKLVVSKYTTSDICVKDLGIEFGCSAALILRILKKNNIERRSRGATKGKPNSGAFNKGDTPWNKGLVLNPNREPSKQIRDCHEGQQWRYKVYKRDNNTCQLCFKHDKGHTGFIRAHHIYRLRDIIKDYGIETIQEALECEILWNTKNGVCLCEECHKIIHKGVMPHGKH